MKQLSQSVAILMSLGFLGGFGRALPSVPFEPKVVVSAEEMKRISALKADSQAKMKAKLERRAARFTGARQ